MWQRPSYCWVGPLGPLQSTHPLALLPPVAEAPCCPTALLPSSSLQWRAHGESSGGCPGTGAPAGTSTSGESGTRGTGARRPAWPAQPLAFSRRHLRAAEATVRGGGGTASAIYHFDRGSRIVQASMSAGGPSLPPWPGNAATHRGAGRLAATARGAGRSAGSASAGGSGAPPLVVFYRRHEQRCGMLVPTELEACWGSGERQRSFLHCDLAQMAAWRSLEMLPGGHAHVA